MGIGGGSARKYHIQAFEKAQNFKATMEHKQLPIDQQLSRILAERITENRAKLMSIAETVILCGRQGIPLRGHHDDWKHLQEAPFLNHGNFLALLDFRIACGDKTLLKHLQSTGHNALYTSKTTQNELIEVCGDIIRTKLLKDIRAAGLFSFTADEVADASNKEQLAISIRYINPATEMIEERFLAYSDCITGVSGEAIADHLLHHLSEWQLSATQLCGQTYDGAGAMARKSKGAAARITERFPKALYTHCFSHVLNLCCALL